MSFNRTIPEAVPPRAATDAFAEARAELAAAQEALANAVKPTDKTKAKRAIKAAEKKLSQAGTVEHAPAASNDVPIPAQSTPTTAPARVEQVPAGEASLMMPAPSNTVSTPAQNTPATAPARAQPVPAGAASLTPEPKPTRERQNKNSRKEEKQSKKANTDEKKQRKAAGAKEEKQNKKKAEKAEKQQAKQADRELKREARKLQQEQRRNQKMLKQEEEQAAADAVAAKASEEIEAARAAGQAAVAGPAFLVRAGNHRELTGPQSGGTLSVEILTCSNLLAADRGKTSDPYVKLQLGSMQIDPLNSAGHAAQTHHVTKDVNPVFNTRLELQVPSLAAIRAASAGGWMASEDDAFRLQVEVWDWNRSTKADILGVLSLDIRQLFAASGWESSIGPLRFPFKEPSESSGHPSGLKASLKSQSSARLATGEPAFGSIELRFSFVPTASDVARMLDMFYRCDINSDGIIDAVEVRELMRAAGIQCGNDYATELVETYGEVRDGKRGVSLVGFPHFWEQLGLNDYEFAPPAAAPEPEPEAEQFPAWVSELFAICDQDSDGNLDATELTDLIGGSLGLPADAQTIADLLTATGVDDLVPFARFPYLLRILGVYDALAAADSSPSPADFTEAFNLFDLDGDGMLSAHELLQMFLTLGYQVDNSYVQQAVSMFGKNAPGFLTPNEFGLLAKEVQIEDLLLSFAAPPVPGPSDFTTVGSTFDRFDLDGDGRLSEDEVLQMLVSLNYEVTGDYVQEVMKLFGSADSDQSGFIDRDEFAALAAQLNIEATLELLDSQHALTAAERGAPAETMGATDAETQQTKKADKELKREARKAQHEERRKQSMFKREEEQAAADAVAAEATTQAAATRLQASWRGRSVRKQLVSAPRRGSGQPRSEAGTALLAKLIELELHEYHGRLREIGVKRLHDLALVTDQELRDIGMNKYDRAALLSARAEVQMFGGQETRHMGAISISPSSSIETSFAAIADEARNRWVEEATQVFMRFCVTDADGRPSLTREGWEAMNQSRIADLRSPQRP